MNSSSRGEDFDALAESFVARLRLGEFPTPEEFAERNPDLADEIHELFPALVAMEAMKRKGDPIANPRPDLGMLERLGDYRILRLIGMGGMGVVYEAERESLQARVALKLLHPRASDDPAYRRRFRNEARSAARLYHNHIVSVFDFGEQDGILYYAMQYIEGAGVDRILDEVRRVRGPSLPSPAPTHTFARTTEPAGPRSIAEALLTGQFPRDPGEDDFELDPSTEGLPAPPGLPPELSRISSLGGSSRVRYHREVARIGAEVAEALAYSHSLGVLHRDIKPSNLLLDSRGTAWITDFGLAKFEGGEDLTESGDIVGTLRYLAPERLEGHSNPLCDVYALGVTLYEMLALRPAFHHENRASLIHKIIEGVTPPLRQLDPRISYDLEPWS